VTIEFPHNARHGRPCWPGGADPARDRRVGSRTSTGALSGSGIDSDQVRRRGHVRGTDHETPKGAAGARGRDGRDWASLAVSRHAVPAVDGPRPTQLPAPGPGGRQMPGLSNGGRRCGGDHPFRQPQARLRVIRNTPHDQVLRNHNVGSTCRVASSGPAFSTVICISRSRGPALA